LHSWHIKTNGRITFAMLAVNALSLAMLLPQ